MLWSLASVRGTRGQGTGQWLAPVTVASATAIDDSARAHVLLWQTTMYLVTNVPVQYAKSTLPDIDSVRDLSSLVNRVSLVTVFGDSNTYRQDVLSKYR